VIGKQLLGYGATRQGADYVGVDGIGTTPIRKPPHSVNRHIPSCMLSEEGGHHRALISKYAEMLKAIIGLFFFSTL
jgi:hypothetical protein